MEKGKTMYNKASHCFIGLTFIFIFGTSCVSCDDAVPSSAPLAQNNLISTVSESSEIKNFELLLDKKMPSWNVGIISKSPDGISNESFFTENDSLGLSADIASKELSLVGTTYSGKNIYKDEGNREMVMSNPGLGFWKFISPPPTDYQIVDDSFSEEDALYATEEMFEQFGMPTNEKVGYTATSVGESDMGPDGVVSKARATARHVRIYREVNGLRVWGSKFMATYTLDGRVFRVGADWPPFKLVSTVTSTVDRAAALKEITDILSKVYGETDAILELDIPLVYFYDKNEMSYDPTLLIQIRPKNEENGIAVFRYSLTKGLYTGDSVLDQTEG